MQPSKTENQFDVCPVCSEPEVVDNEYLTKFGERDHRTANKKCMHCLTEFWPEEEARVGSDSNHNLVCYQDVVAVLVDDEKGEKLEDVTLTWPL